MKKILSLFLVVAATAVAEAPQATVCLHGAAECQLINQWHAEGTAAGNKEDYYDNRDRAHSMLNIASFPQLSLIGYTEDEKKVKEDWGAQKRLLKKVIIGNSSTASGPETGGSNVRAWYYTWNIGMQFLHSQYRGNNLYVYPCHLDHTPGHNGHKGGYGDLNPTNSPYVIISQGSSGSDQVFLNAFVHTLAAFRPEVKQRLIKKGLLIPTLQAIFRASNKNIESKEDYLTGKAHPSVFSGELIDPVKMVKAAHAMQLTSIPPLVQLDVVTEGIGRDERGYEASDDTSETLSDTPSVIARVIRKVSYSKRMVISAKRSFDINSSPLNYHWVVLRGDPKKILITPIGNGDVAEIVVPYHGRRPISEGASLESNRVDIGVFADNGQAYSAPAFVTFFCFDDEFRTYDDEENLVEIYYDVSEHGCDISNLGSVAIKLLDHEKSLGRRLILQELSDQEKGELSKFDPNGDNSLLQKKIEGILSRLIQKINLYTDNAAEINALALAASQADQERFNAAKKMLLDLKILQQTDSNTVTIQSARTGELSSVEQLTPWERYEIEKLNLAILSSIFYPHGLKAWEVKNFVDPRLKVPRAWRDLFEYDSNGNFVGWIRYQESVISRHNVPPKNQRPVVSGARERSR